MKNLALIVLMGLCASAFAQEAPTPAPTVSDSPLARSHALELAGAFANDGYKVRDGFWSGTLELGKPLLLEVNLFAGNEYWFSGAATNPARKIAVKVFDAKGKPVETELYAESATAAAGFAPVMSGPYLVQIELMDGEKAPFCLVYSYK